MGKLVEALILIITEIRTLRDVFNEVRELEDVEEAKMILGPYDIMVTVKSKEGEVPESLLNKIREIDGVSKTVTNIFIKD